MDSLKLSVVSLCLLAALTHLTHAQSTPKDFLAVHNAARAAVGVPPLAWDDKLASWAQDYINKKAETCEMVHSHGPYGENLASGSFLLNANDAVSMWLTEKQEFDQGGGTGSCFQNGGCGHYTQVVWRKSERVGCAVANCKNGWSLVSCNYDPPGNVIGQRPF